MREVVSSIFPIILLPFEDRIIMIEQQSFDNSISLASSGSTILVIDNSQSPTENVGVGMYPSLMGSLNISALVLTIGSTLGSESSSLSSVPFRTMYLKDP